MDTRGIRKMMGLGGMGLLVGVVLWGGLIVLAIWLVRSLFPPAEPPPATATSGGASAREILDRRYARGEISQEEYDVMKASLTD